MSRRHIVLVGLPGAGKTTVGKAVAEKLACPFVDVDAIIVRKTQMPVERFFAEFGEQKFRAVEKEAVAEALGHDAAVVVPGGGWAAQDGNLDGTQDVLACAGFGFRDSDGNGTLDDNTLDGGATAGRRGILTPISVSGWIYVTPTDATITGADVMEVTVCAVR